MNVRCPASKHLLFSVADDVTLNTEIEIKCVCKRFVRIRDPRTPEVTRDQSPLRSESFPREETAHASTEFGAGLHR